jgi:hypothetical protein
MPKGTRALILSLLATDALALLASQALVRFTGGRLLAEPPAILQTASGHLLVAAVLDSLAVLKAVNRSLEDGGRIVPVEYPLPCLSRC